MLVMLLSHGRYDPSFGGFSSGAIQNWFGAPGAVVAGALSDQRRAGKPADNAASSGVGISASAQTANRPARCAPVHGAVVIFALLVAL